MYSLLHITPCALATSPMAKAAALVLTIVPLVAAVVYDGIGESNFDRLVFGKRTTAAFIKCESEERYNLRLL